MPSLLPGYEYDIFISYRQNDNRSGWVRQFVEDLREELGATLKDSVNIYFDENPHDGLQDTHLVDESLKGKLKCLIFIPILSRTYCDQKSFAWNHEFVPFCQGAREDSLGLLVRLENGNTASRVLPILLHDIDSRDKNLFEQTSGAVLRPVDFVFRSPGVNRPLTLTDERGENQSKTIYRDQINKVANAIGGILNAYLLSPGEQEDEEAPSAVSARSAIISGDFLQEIRRRNVIRAGISYVIISVFILQLLSAATPYLKIEERIIILVSRILAFGLPIAMVLAWMYEVSPHGLIRTTSEKANENPFPPSRKKPLTGTPAIFVLVLSLGLLALYTKLILEDSPVASKGNPVSVAVLPFESRGGEYNEKYMADALTEDIIGKLSILPELTVTNRKSTQKYQGKLLSALDAVGEELNVEKILLGNVRREGDKVIIYAELVNASNNRFMWSNTFTRTVRNFMTVDAEIALAVAVHLQIDLSEEEQKPIARRLTNHDSAYFHYSLGRNLYYKYNKTANDSAIAEFRMAIEADPGYALAWAGLGDAFSQVYTFRNDQAWLDSSLNAGQRAILLDPTLSEGYKAMANAYNYKKLYDKAFPLLKKAVELSPSNASAVGNLGTAHFFRAEFIDALTLEKRSAGITPSNWIAYQMIGWIYGLLGDHDRAVESLNKSLELQPYAQTYEILAYNYVAQGRKREALKLVPRILELGMDDHKVLELAGLIAHFAGDPTTARTHFEGSIRNNKNYKTDANTPAPIGLGQILLEEGKRVEADVLLTHALAMNQQEYERGSQDDEVPFRIAAIYAIRGRKEEMLHWLQKAKEARWVDFTQVTHGPWFARYRTDRDVTQLIEPIKKEMADMRKKVN